MDTEQSNNTDTTASGAQITTGEMIPAEVRAAAQQLQESISSYMRENQSHWENILTVIKQVSGQLQTTDAKGLKNSADIDKLSGQIRNYRN